MSGHVTKEEFATMANKQGGTIMARTLTKEERETCLENMNEKERLFCKMLTEVCIECGFGLTGNKNQTSISIYELGTGPDSDYDRKFYIDNDGDLQFN